MRAAIRQLCVLAVPSLHAALALPGGVCTRHPMVVAAYSRHPVVVAAYSLAPPGAAESRSLLSVPFDELSESIGDSGARYVWRRLRAGVDPLEGATEEEAVEASRCGLTRAKQAELGSSLQPIDSLAQVSHLTVSADGTQKMLLQLADGLEESGGLRTPCLNSDLERGSPPTVSGERRGIRTPSCKTPIWSGGPTPAPLELVSEGWAFE